MPSVSCSISTVTLVARLVDLLEDHAAGVVVAVERTPGDDLVRALLGDLGVPLMALAADLGDPVEMRVVGLRDRLDALHEAWELLELRPLVVDRSRWDNRR